MGARSVKGEAHVIPSCQGSNNLMVVGSVVQLLDWRELHCPGFLCDDSGSICNVLQCTVLNIMTNYSWQDGFHAQTKMADVSLVLFPARGQTQASSNYKLHKDIQSHMQIQCGFFIPSGLPVCKCVCLCASV